MSESNPPGDPDQSPATSPFDSVSRKLREVYDRAATEPLPDAFEELLRQLR